MKSQAMPPNSNGMGSKLWVIILTKLSDHATREWINKTNPFIIFSAFAVRDRIDFSHLSDTSKPLDPSTVDLKRVLPSDEDCDALLSNFADLALRLLVEHAPALAKYSPLAVRHIPHKYLTAMAWQRSLKYYSLIGVLYL